MEARKALDQAAKEAYAALLLAQAFDGPEVVAGAALGVPPLEGVEAEVENVWGSKVPRLKATFPDGALLSPVGTPAYTLEASRAFRRYAEALIRVANTETRLKKIGEEIKKTTRRVNALEQVVIPGIRAQIRFIQQVLEQREREDTFRLKRIKGKIEAREAEEEGGRPNPQVEIGAGL